jgi:hypothetical protein
VGWHREAKRLGARGNIRVIQVSNFNERGMQSLAGLDKVAQVTEAKVGPVPRTHRRGASPCPLFLGA